MVNPISDTPAFIVLKCWQTAQRAVAVSLVDAQQCIPAERKSVNRCFVHARMFVIAALFWAVVLCAYRTPACFACIVCCAFWFRTSVIEALPQTPQAFREKLDQKLDTLLTLLFAFVCFSVADCPMGQELRTSRTHHNYELTLT
ncbi:hypothetical protein [uncultured Ruminococcus sp.]|uniref:hypothetical protein n=1 Tax=uncultured Ruminococcus sp. TaxID=165186 RepID=UPI0025E213D7|nr:hypothetical protein [uncultured Ruminococcus sp.]